MSSENEIYKNAPLIETIFEIIFPAEPSIECNRDKFYEKIRNVYSKIFISNSKGSTFVAQPPYRFEREDGASGVIMSINKISFYCKKYEGFKSFKKETVRVFSLFRETFKVEKLRRTGLRYINIIPFTREKNVIPIKNYLNIRIDLTKSISTDFKNFNMIFASQTEGGSITTHIEPIISEAQTEAIMLDFDYAKESDLDFGSIKEYLEESHEHTKDLFERLITDNYRKVMRGEVI